MRIHEIAGYSGHTGPVVTVYHAQWHSWPNVLRQRVVKTYNSMGTWFTSNPIVAGEVYGDKVGVFEIPAEGWLEAPEHDVNETLGHCYPLIEKHLTKHDYAQLQRLPWNHQTREEYRRLRDYKEECRSKQDKRGFGPCLTMEQNRRLFDLDKSLEVTRKALCHADYCKKYREMILHSRHRGVVWRNSLWEHDTERSDIYLAMHDEDIHPVRTFMSDREPAEHAGTLALMRQHHSDE